MCRYVCFALHTNVTMHTFRDRCALSHQPAYPVLDWTCRPWDELPLEGLVLETGSLFTFLMPKSALNFGGDSHLTLLKP